MRDDYDKFLALGAVIVATGRDAAAAFREHWSREKLPFTGIPDTDHTIARKYGQRWRLLGLGRQPSVVVIDKEGRIRSRHDGGQMWDIPSNGEIFELLGTLGR